MSIQRVVNWYFDDHWCGRLCTEEVHQLNETDNSWLSLGRWELRCYVHSLRCWLIVLRKLRCELARRDGETVSLYELLRCEYHLQEVRVFSHLYYLPLELEHILDPGLILVVAHMELPQENMAVVGTVQVGDIDMLVALDQWEVQEVDHAHHKVAGVVLYPYHLVHRQQQLAQRLSETKQDGRDTPD